MRKILLTGREGQLGWQLQRTLAPLGTVFSFDRQSLNLADGSKLRRMVQELQPQLIVNAAAYTAVDKAETESEAAFAVNGLAPGILAEEAKKLDALLVHYSTDYVFDGLGTAPYLETQKPNPVNLYGSSKLAGEKAIQQVGGRHLILRTSWVYGTSGKNFLLTMLKLAQERPELSIVGDQLGAPTWSRMIAEMTSQMINVVLNQGLSAELSGTYHLSAAGHTSWFNFAKSLLELYQKRNPAFKLPLLHEIATADYPTPAKRPAYSVLSNAKLLKTFGMQMPDWESSLAQCMEAL